MNCTSHDTNRIIGNKIYQLRRSINMTQQELAEKVGISVHSYQKSRTDENPCPWTP